MIEGPRAASTLLLDTFTEGAFEREMEALHGRLGGSADLVFLFLSPGWLPKLALVTEICQIRLRCPIIAGCTAGGLVGDGGEFENTIGCSVLALHLPGTTITVEHWPAAPTLAPEPIAPSSGAGAVLLANPLHLSVDPFLDAWDARHPGLQAYGGFASGGVTESTLAIFTHLGITDAACLAIHLHGGIRIDGVLGQACRPIGPDHIITGAEGNIITSLSGLPPMKCLENALREDASHAAHPSAIGPGMLHAGFAPVTELISTPNADTPSGAGPIPGTDVLIRAIIGADPETGAIALAGQPQVGQSMRFHLRQPDAATSHWQSSLEAAKSRHPALPIAGLLFPCLGRGNDFFGLPDHDASLLRDTLGGFPTAGLFVNGELATGQGTLNAHTFSAVAALIYPATQQLG